METDPTPDADPAVVAVLGRSSRRAPVVWFGGAVLLAIVLAGGAALALRAGAPDAYQTEVVSRGALVVTVTAVGQLEPKDSVEIGSKLSGRVAEVLVRANEPVKRGQPLARLEPGPFENAVVQAKAQLAVARASLAQARVTEAAAAVAAARKVRLLEQEAATAVEAEDAGIEQEKAAAGRAAAAAELALREAVLAHAEADLADTVITAPIDGVVTGRLVDPGQTLVSAMSASALFTIASNLKDLKAEVGVDEADVGRVTAGMPARFTVTAWPDRTFEATVAAVDLAPQDDEDVVTYDAELQVRNDDLQLRPGLTATVEIEVDRLEDVLMVPSTALRFALEPGHDGDGVWVLDGDTPRRAPVIVLGDDGLSTAVRGDGLGVGDRVIVGREAT